MSWKPPRGRPCANSALGEARCHCRPRALSRGRVERSAAHTVPRGDEPGEPGRCPRCARGCGHQAAGIAGTVGQPRVPEPGPSVRARPAARNHGSRRLGAQPPSAPQQPPRCQGGKGGQGRALAPARLGRAGPGARNGKPLGPRGAVPLPGAGGGRGCGPGTRWRGAPGAACPRGRARGAAGRGAGPGRRIRCSRRLPRPRAPSRGRGRWRGEPRRGGARSSPAAGTAGAAGGLVGIPGAVAAPISPQNRGARARGHGRRSRAVSAGCGARRRLAFPVPSSLGPQYSLPRSDPAAKGWAGKRALWDRCQLRDKRHKIGGNGGSAAGALGRGRRRRGGRILGADPGKFGKSPRRLRSGGGCAARVALRAALALSAPLLNNSWRGRRPLACTGRAARLCQAAAAFGARAARDERPRGGRAHAVPALACPVAPIVPRPAPRGCPQARLHPAARPTARLCKSWPATPAPECT